jgi:hypothetical protein
MQENHCCCKHSMKKTDENCKRSAALRVAVLTSLLPHFFCCFMPLIFTAIIGGAMAVFFHDYWYVVSGVAALAATIIIYMLRNEKLSFVRVGGNVVIALGVAFVFNVMFHPSHSQAQGDRLHAPFDVAQSDHNHAHSHD